MNYRQAFAALGVALMTGAVAAPAVQAAGTIKTTVNIMDTGLNKHKQYVVGAVCTSKCGGKALNGEKVVVKYLHKTSSGWHLVDKTKATIGAPPLGDSGYNAEVGPAVAKGTCKITIAYPGDNKYAASHSAQKLDCSTGQPPY